MEPNLDANSDHSETIQSYEKMTAKSANVAAQASIFCRLKYSLRHTSQRRITGPLLLSGRPSVLGVLSVGIPEDLEFSKTRFFHLLSGSILPTLIKLNHAQPLQVFEDETRVKPECPVRKIFLYPISPIPVRKLIFAPTLNLALINY